MKLKDGIHVWLYPKNDFVFKLLFGSNTSTSKELLVHFLNDLFEVPEGYSLSGVELQNPQLNKQHLRDKASILDIRAQILGGSAVNIEIQLKNQYNIDRRTLFYSAKMITQQLHEGDNYKKLRKVTAINILDFNYFPQEQYHSIYLLTEKKAGTLYPDLLQLHFIEMLKFKKQLIEKRININDRLAKWVHFISNEDDQLWEVMAKTDPIIKKAVNLLKIISQDPENRWNYEIRQKVLKDMASMKEGAWEEGLEEGKVIKEKEIALKMLRKGVDIESIIEFTGLAKEDVLELQREDEQD